MVPWVAWVLLALALLVLVDRLMLLAEARGIVHWRRSPPPAGTTSAAMLSMQILFEPAAEHVVEERQHSQDDIHVAVDGDPSIPATAGRTRPRRH